MQQFYLGGLQGGGGVGKAGDICPICVTSFQKTFPVKHHQQGATSTTRQPTSQVLSCRDCKNKVHARCASKLFETVEEKDDELYLRVQTKTVQTTEQIVQTTSAEFMHVPKESNTVTQTCLVPIGNCDLTTDWTCDRCTQHQSQSGFTSPCLLCNEETIRKELSKLTECILNDNDRTWCHLSCARWHEEIRTESKKRFLFTDKNALRQNEDKVINDCFVCDDPSRRELLVKCLDCENYAHPSCLTKKKPLDSYSLYYLLAKGKTGYSCCRVAYGGKAPTVIITDSLIDTNKSNKVVQLEWNHVEFGLAELSLRTIVQEMRDKKMNLVCEVCSLILAPVASQHLSNQIQVCSSCNIVCHKKCNTESTCGIKNFKCKTCDHLQTLGAVIERRDTEQNLQQQCCRICGLMGGILTFKDKQHPVCRNFKRQLKPGATCIHCGQGSSSGAGGAASASAQIDVNGMIRCDDDECDVGAHPFCHLTHLKSLHSSSNTDLEAKKFDLKLGRCHKHSLRRVVTRVTTLRSDALVPQSAAVNLGRTISATAAATLREEENYYRPRDLKYYEKLNETILRQTLLHKVNM